MTKGDIFIAFDAAKHPHPIVFLEMMSDDKIAACIISTDSGHGNIKMSEKDFFKQDENGNDYYIMYNNSYLIPGRVFEKELLWFNSEKRKGKLTKLGIKFVEECANGVKPEYHPVPVWITKK